MSTKHRINAENAPQVYEWLRRRGGIAIWDSLNLSDPGLTWTTPLNNKDGTRRTDKPHWSAHQISRVITDPADVEVVVPRELKRFHVAVRKGTNGRVVKLTNASGRRLRRAVTKAAQEFGDAWHEFDYLSRKNAVIFVPTEVVSLDEWMGRQDSPQQEPRRD